MRAHDRRQASFVRVLLDRTFARVTVSGIHRGADLSVVIFPELRGLLTDGGNRRQADHDNHGQHYRVFDSRWTTFFLNKSTYLLHFCFAVRGVKQVTNLWIRRMAET